MSNAKTVQEDNNLVSQLENVLQGVRYVTEGEYPVKVLLLPGSEEGLTTERVTSSIGFDTISYSLTDLLNEKLPATRGIALSIDNATLAASVKALKNIYTSLEPFASEFELHSLEPAENAMILLARTKDHSSTVAVSFSFNSSYTSIPLSNAGFRAFPDFKMPALEEEQMQRHAALIDVLDKSVSGNDFASEILEGIVWTLNSSRELAYENIIQATNLLAIENGLSFEFNKGDEFFEDDDAEQEEDDEELEEDELWELKLARARAIMLQQSDIRTWYLSGGAHEIVSLGRTSAGNYIGLRTTAVWT